MTFRRAWLAILLFLSGCVGSAAPPTGTPSAVTPSATPSATPTGSPSPTPTPAAEFLIAAGDIASCDEEADSSTAALVAELDGTVAALGDLAYPAGSDATYAECYDPVWGEFLDRTRPAIGNHDMQDDDGAAYYRYFGARAGAAGEGWYSYDLAAWHVIVLNSNCELVGCSPGTEQHAWLLADLAATDTHCTLAYWHHPRFSSGPHGDDDDVAPLWEALAEADADVVLVGHDHLYERFAPQAGDGTAIADGIRQFTVGTGGKGLYDREEVAPNSEVLIDDAFGVLELRLAPDSYDWRFLTTDDVEADAGSGTCH